MQWNGFERLSSTMQDKSSLIPYFTSCKISSLLQFLLNIVTVLNDNNDIKFHWPMFDEHIFQLILFNSHIDTISLTMQICNTSFFNFTLKLNNKQPKSIGNFHFQRIPNFKHMACTHLKPEYYKFINYWNKNEDTTAKIFLKLYTIFCQ